MFGRVHYATRLSFAHSHTQICHTQTERPGRMSYCPFLHFPAKKLKPRCRSRSPPDFKADSFHAVPVQHSRAPFFCVYSKNQHLFLFPADILLNASSSPIYCKKKNVVLNYSHIKCSEKHYLRAQKCETWSIAEPPLWSTMSWTAP